MALSLTLDYSLPELNEPGFWRFYSTRDIAEQGNPSDNNSAKDIFRDDPTRTLMLMPRQLQPDFLNTEQQATSLIRLNDFQVEATNLSGGKIYEAPVGTNANPYIWHVPAGPASFFPAAPNPNPGSPPSLVSVPVPYDMTGLDLVTQFRNDIYQVPATIPDPVTPPAPVTVGGTADGIWLCHTKVPLAANQGLFLRWTQPDSRAGFPMNYRFFIGQYCLNVKDVVCEVLRDISPAGDRTAWKKVQVCPLWSLSDVRRPMGSLIPDFSAGAIGAHDRQLMWLPFRRHQVLLWADTRQTALLTTRATAARLPDNSDWDIVRADTLAIWVMTPAPGRIQVQKLAFSTNTVKVQAPTVIIDYTPSGSPTITLTKDSDYSSTLTAAQTQPPSYTLPVNDANDCPPATANAATDQARTYGVELTFHSADGRHTPYFYGYQIETVRSFATRPTTPLTINDLSSASYYLEHATISAGMRPGEGRLTAKVADTGAFSLSPYYYRCSMPVRLTSGGTAVFTGWTEPQEVIPLKLSGAPRDLTFSALDRWKQLTEVILKDQRDWTDYGHIEVVLFTMQQAGIDTTSAVTPPYTPNVAGTYNTPLGLGGVPLAQQTKQTAQGWKPGPTDTAASYIQRIARVFSGWDVGFYTDGNPFYLPKDYYTTPTVTFADTTATAAGNPIFREPVVFRTIEPEANAIIVYSGSAANGDIVHSSLWIDWASIKNKNAVNYLGKRRAEAIPLGRAFTCAQLNYMARTIFQDTRRRHRIAEFAADFVPGFQVGQVCTLGTYGNYRLQSIEAQFVKNNWRPARYTAELLEKGYGT